VKRRTDRQGSKESKTRARMLSEAKALAGKDGEPIGLVKFDGVTIMRPYRKCLAICASHPGAVLLEEVDPA